VVERAVAIPGTFELLEASVAAAHAALRAPWSSPFNPGVPTAPAAVNRERRTVALQALTQAIALMRPYQQPDWTVAQIIRAMDETGHATHAAEACRLMREAVKISRRLPATGA
jgi:hypothetical protein